MANKIVQLHDEANNNIYPVTTLDAIHGSGALRADFVLKAGDTMTGPLTATKFIGPLQGNADSATKLTSNAGDSNTPIYFSDGKPVACTGLDLNTTGSSASCTGNSATATKLATARTINGMSFNGTAAINNYGVCSTAAATAAKTVTVGSTFALVTGAQVTVKFTNSNSAASPTLNVNSTGAKPIYRYGTTVAGTSTTTSGWNAGAVMHLTYDGTGWIRDYWANSTYYTTAVQCTTAAATAAKVGSCSYYTAANNRYFMCMMAYDNTYAGAITLNINSAGAKPIYINGSASSDTNYTLPKGMYLVYYNGTNYYFRTDGVLQGGTYAGTASYASALNCRTTTSNTKYYILGKSGTSGGNSNVYFAYNSAGTNNTTGVYFNGSTGVLTGAAWNDYAEYRAIRGDIKAGQVVCENGDDTLSMSQYRLQPGAEIVSDTYGFIIGETDKATWPIAVSGRVLAYPFEPREEFKPGDAVCAGPGGTVSIMTREEIREYPERIIGTVSAIPGYDKWGFNDNVEVDGRIWIKVK